MVEDCRVGTPIEPCGLSPKAPSVIDRVSENQDIITDSLFTAREIKELIVGIEPDSAEKDSVASDGLLNALSKQNSDMRILVGLLRRILNELK
jgi:hypothetical protein